jgi:hypothetical protein
MIKRRSTCPNCGQEMYRTDPAADNGRTHWPECWRDRTHHACAVAAVEQARADAAALELENQELRKWRERMEILARENDSFRADAAQWRARYMAAHDVLLCVEAHVEAHNQPGSSADAISFYRMRAAFLAYRATIEAGAPLGWAVAEEQLPDAEAQRAQSFAENS